jgi:hypothetical protein
MMPVKLDVSSPMPNLARNGELLHTPKKSTADEQSDASENLLVCRFFPLSSSMGANPRGACAQKYATAISPDRMKAA